MDSPSSTRTRARAGQDWSVSSRCVQRSSMSMYGSSGRVTCDSIHSMTAQSYKTSETPKFLGSLVPWRDVRHCERDSAGTHRARERERERERYSCMMMMMMMTTVEGGGGSHEETDCDGV